MIILRHKHPVHLVAVWSLSRNVACSGLFFELKGLRHPLIVNESKPYRQPPLRSESKPARYPEYLSEPAPLRQLRLESEP
jgi:hypothetical protein